MNFPAIENKVNGRSGIINSGFGIPVLLALCTPGVADPLYIFLNTYRHIRVYIYKSIHSHLTYEQEATRRHRATPTCLHSSWTSTGLHLVSSKHSRANVSLQTMHDHPMKCCPEVNLRALLCLTWGGSSWRLLCLCSPWSRAGSSHSYDPQQHKNLLLRS